MSRTFRRLPADGMGWRELMESTFGPFYPSPLQESVNHAERLVSELRRLDDVLLVTRAAFARPSSEEERWILGRDGEVVALVADVADEWRANALSADAAASVLDRYLDQVHHGLAHTFGLDAPACCARPSATRVALESPTRVAPLIDVLALSLRRGGPAPR